MFFDEVGITVNILVKIGVEKTLEFPTDYSYFLPLALSKRTTGLGKIRFFTFYLFYHLACPVLTQRNCLDHGRQLPVKLLLTDKGLMTPDRLGLFRAAIVDVGCVAVGAAVVLGVEFRGHHHPTLAATKKSGVELDRPFLVPCVASFLPYLLYLVKQFLCDEWLMNSFVDLAREAEVAVVEGIGEKLTGNAVLFARSAVPADDTISRQKIRNVHNPVRAGGKQLKRLFNNGSLLAINDDGFGPGIVEIPHRRNTGHLTSPDFLAKTAFRVF